MIYFTQLVGFLIGFWDETKAFLLVADNFFVAGSGFVTAVRIRIQESQINEGTAGSVKTIIRNLPFFKNYYLFL
jgi:hypothetical protein